MIRKRYKLVPIPTRLILEISMINETTFYEHAHDFIFKINVDGAASGYMNDHSLFLEHVHRVASYVINKKGMIPIIWDDMLRKIQSEKLVESGIGRLVEPMVWVYVEDIDRFIYSFTWSTYAEVFPHLWTASAYKGAFGEQLYIVNVARHVYNNLAWLDVMKRETLGPEKVC